jgi:hydrogenase-4 component E
MIDFLLILFIMTLLYAAIANRMQTYLWILILQGAILSGLSYFLLTKIEVYNLVLIIAENLIFKTIAVPWFLNTIIKRNQITRETEPYLPNFVSLMIVTAIILLSIVITTSLNDIFIAKNLFIVAISTLFSALYLIMSRRKIITHVICYLILENGVFLLSLSTGNEMPMLVNLGIMLDIFASVLILGVFFNKIGDVLKDPDVGLLRNLKD